MEIWSKLSNTTKKVVVNAKCAYTNGQKANNVNQTSKSADEYFKSTRSKSKHTGALNKSSNNCNCKTATHFAKLSMDISKKPMRNWNGIKIRLQTNLSHNLLLL